MSKFIIVLDYNTKAFGIKYNIGINYLNKQKKNLKFSKIFFYEEYDLYLYTGYGVYYSYVTILDNITVHNINRKYYADQIIISKPLLISNNLQWQDKNYCKLALQNTPYNINYVHHIGNSTLRELIKKFPFYIVHLSYKLLTNDLIELAAKKNIKLTYLITYPSDNFIKYLCEYKPTYLSKFKFNAKQIKLITETNYKAVKYILLIHRF
jgi:hypothetical protein